MQDRAAPMDNAGIIASPRKVYDRPDMQPG